MQLNISEFDTDNANEYDNSSLYSSFEKIPENIPIKIIKQNDNANSNTNKLRPIINNKNHIKQVSYDDILSKMNMFVSDGKLHTLDRQQLTPSQKTQINKSQPQKINSNAHENIPQNSYIYNKYFKEDIKEPNVIRQPKTLDEYKIMVLKDYIQRQRIKQIKSKRIMIPTSNINFSQNSGNLNKLFRFSNK